MADLEPEDFMFEAEEDMADTNPDDPTDKGADGRSPMLRIPMFKPWKARAQLLFRPNPYGELTSRPQCLFLTPPKS
jgi:hypothetical protein